MGWSAFGVRDAMLLLVAVAAIYLVVMLLRLIHVGRQRHPPVAHDLAESPRVETISPLRHRVGTEETEPLLPEPVFAVPPAPTFEWDEVKDLFGDAIEVPPSASRPESQPTVPAPVAPHASGFGERLADHLARSDVEMEVQRMRDEMARMRAEVEELRAARRVSPQYAEAMELAQRGFSAQDVATRLGISLAEAELVHALSRGSKDFEKGDEHGEDRYADNR